MTISSGSGVVRNGLVFHYDMENSAKSWKGKPVTNLYADGNFASKTLHPVQNGPNTFVENAGPQGQTCLRIGADGTYNYHGRDITVTIGNTYNASVWCYVSTDYDGAMAKLVGEQGFAPDRNYDMTKKGTWQKLSISGTATTTNARILCYNTVTPYATTGYSLWTEVQFEENSFATPYVSGTRSNTEALVDLTGNNTITANSLTYNSDGTFEFDGTTNYATFGDDPSIGDISYCTVDAWVYYDAYVGNGGSQTYSVVTHKGTPWTWLMENPSNKGRIRFTIGGSDVNCSDPDTHPLNTWMHWVGIYDGSNMKFYRDGVLKNTVAKTGALANNTIAATLGQYSGSYRMNGKIGSVKIYNRALSAEEVLQNYEASRGRYGV